MGKDFLTVDQLKQLWQSKLFPSIRKEVNSELAKINGCSENEDLPTPPFFSVILFYSGSN